MTKTLTGILTSLLLLLATLQVPCGAEEFKAGVDYDLVNPPQPTQDPKKVEVIEFFWYGCPHCLEFEPDLNAWLKTKPQNVLFIREPAVFSAQWAAHAKAFYTAEALGVGEKLHADFFDAIQHKKEKLLTEDEQAQFFVAHGIDEAAFHQAYKSFAVDSKMRIATAQGPKYGITGTPSLVVNGKYLVSPGKSKSFPRMIEITNALIAQESGKKK
jgi:protein dithiol oxidoreductase (disulfide-forming)